MTTSNLTPKEIKLLQKYSSPITDSHFGICDVPDELDQIGVLSGSEVIENYHIALYLAKSQFSKVDFQYTIFSDYLSPLDLYFSYDSETVNSFVESNREEFPELMWVLSSDLLQMNHQMVRVFLKAISTKFFVSKERCFHERWRRFPKKQGFGLDNLYSFGSTIPRFKDWFIDNLWRLYRSYSFSRIEIILLFKGLNFFNGLQILDNIEFKTKLQEKDYFFVFDLCILRGNVSKYDFFKRGDDQRFFLEKVLKAFIEKNVNSKEHWVTFMDYYFFGRTKIKTFHSGMSLDDVNNFFLDLKYSSLSRKILFSLMGWFLELTGHKNMVYSKKHGFSFEKKKSKSKNLRSCNISGKEIYL